VKGKEGKGRISATRYGPALGILAVHPFFKNKGVCNCFDVSCGIGGDLGKRDTIIITQIGLGYG